MDEKLFEAFLKAQLELVEYTIENLERKIESLPSGHKMQWGEFEPKEGLPYRDLSGLYHMRKMLRETIRQTLHGERIV